MKMFKRFYILYHIMTFLIGTAGIFDSEKIECAEISFTHGVRITDKRTKLIKSIAKKNDLQLSVHAPYYINLNSNDTLKIEASKKRIFDSARAANLLGTNKVVFHAGYYMGKTKKEAYKIIRDGIVDILDFCDDQDVDVDLLPEAMGKVSQFGSISELISLHDELGINFCVDFSHLKARNLGSLNYKEIVNQVSSFKKLHSHFSGIEFGQKGEIRHLNVDLNESKELINAIIDSPIKKLSMICESPNTYDDAIAMIKQRNSLYLK